MVVVVVVVIAIVIVTVIYIYIYISLLAPAKEEALVISHDVGVLDLFLDLDPKRP